MEVYVEKYSRLWFEVQEYMQSNSVSDFRHVDWASIFLGMVLRHRNIHPVRAIGCRTCEGFLNTVPDHFGQNGNGYIKVSEYKEMMKLEAQKKKANGFSLTFRARTRRNGGVDKEVLGVIQNRTSKWT